MPNSHRGLNVLVSAIRYEARNIISIELRRPDKEDLPPFTVGAHITVGLPNGLERSYSLVSSPDDLRKYIIAVSRDPASRGGSSYLHEALHVGEILYIGFPQNNFQLVEPAEQSIFFAGGIGITPLWNMIQRLEALNRHWELHYAARSRDSAAFLDDLDALELVETGRLHCQFNDEHPGEFIDMGSVIDNASSTAHLYCCGPNSMLRTFEKAAGNRPADHVHVEYFSSGNLPSIGVSFTVVLSRSGRKIFVPSETTILDALLAEGVDVSYSCKEGTCGTCEVRVLEGEPDHRDVVLSDSEKAANNAMMICCSRAKGDVLVLDL